MKAYLTISRWPQETKWVAREFYRTRELADMAIALGKEDCPTRRIEIIEVELPDEVANGTV